MAHELTIRQNGTVEHAYVGDVGWHGLGNQLARGAAIEEWLKAAGMDWSIRRAKVRYPVSCADADSPEAWRTMDDRHVLLRSDNGNPLGIVSDGYKPVQPKEVLEFFRDLVGAAGFELETAGTLFGGKRMWALASIGEEAKIADAADKVKGYLLLCTACDGTMMTEGRYTTIRVVCNNTMEFARGREGAKVKVTHRTTFNPSIVKKELGIDTGRSRFADTIASMRRLAETSVSDIDMLSATAELFVPSWRELSKADQAKQLERTSGALARVGELALDRKAIGSDLSGVSGTAWGWLNAVTEYVDHHAPTRGDSKADNRINSAWFGRGADVKAEAFGMANAMADYRDSKRGATVTMPGLATMPEAAAVATLDGSDILAGLLAKPSTLKV